MLPPADLYNNFLLTNKKQNLTITIPDVLLPVGPDDAMYDLYNLLTEVRLCSIDLSTTFLSELLK